MRDSEKHSYSHEEVREYRESHFGPYFNPNDSNFIVPKRYGHGLTMNLAHPIAILILLVAIALVIITTVTRIM